MNSTADAEVRNRRVICSRCGAEMHPEQFWHEETDGIPFLYWRCETGHITQALPIPYKALAAALISPEPLL